MSKNTFHLVSLGCSKNTVDSDSMAQLLTSDGYSFVEDPSKASVLIVNTCGFIGPAKDESYRVLEELAQGKKKSQVLIAAGCLTQRYGVEVAKRVPGIDGILGTRRWMDIVQVVHETRKGKHPEPIYHLPEAPTVGADENGAPLVFDDQYICTGGQLYELLAGRDRMLGDLRPLAFAELGLAKPITCHPYDACTALVLEEAGCRVTAPFGGPLDFPLDTTSPVAWVGFANAAIEAHVRPALDACLARFFPRAAQARAANVIGSQP